MIVPRLHVSLLLCTVAALILAVEEAAAQEGGIEVFAGETLFEGGTRISGSYIYKLKDDLYQGSHRTSDPLDRREQEHRFVAGMDYGALPELTLSLLVPYVTRELKTNTLTFEGDGLGDVALLAKYRVVKEDWFQSAFHISLIGGVETPTGRTDLSDNGMRLPDGLQPGSGSWDPFGAVSLNLNLERWRFDGLLFGKLNTEGTRDFERGGFASVQVGAAYRFLHEKYPGASASAKIALQWRHEDRAEQGGTTVLNTGSEGVFIRPGLTWHPAPQWDITGSVDLPLYQSVHGMQLGTAARVFLAVGIRF